MPVITDAKNPFADHSASALMGAYSGDDVYIRIKPDGKEFKGTVRIVTNDTVYQLIGRLDGNTIKGQWGNEERAFSFSFQRSASDDTIYIFDALDAKRELTKIPLTDFVAKWDADDVVVDVKSAGGDKREGTVVFKGKEYPFEGTVDLEILRANFRVGVEWYPFEMTSAIDQNSAQQIIFKTEGFEAGLDNATLREQIAAEKRKRDAEAAAREAEQQARKAAEAAVRRAREEAEAKAKAEQVRLAAEKKEAEKADLLTQRAALIKKIVSEVSTGPPWDEVHDNHRWVGMYGVDGNPHGRIYLEDYRTEGMYGQGFQYDSELEFDLRDIIRISDVHTSDESCYVKISLKEAVGTRKKSRHSYNFFSGEKTRHMSTDTVETFEMHTYGLRADDIRPLCDELERVEKELLNNYDWVRGN